MTVSLKEGVVRVWKVGPSTGSTLLHPMGRPPRQGEIGSRPYKTFPFNVGEEGAPDVYPAVDKLLLNLFFASFLFDSQHDSCGDAQVGAVRILVISQSTFAYT